MKEECIVHEKPKQVLFSYFNEPQAGMTTPQICMQTRYNETAERYRPDTVLEARGTGRLCKNHNWDDSQVSMETTEATRQNT